MKMPLKRGNRERGATITEYAVALLFIGLVLALVAMPIQSLLKSRLSNVKESNRGQNGMAPCSKVNRDDAGNPRSGYLNPVNRECL